MRNEDRIDLIIDKIKLVWHKYPDLRLGQLLVALFGHDNIFYDEDEILLEILNKEITL